MTELHFILLRGQPMILLSTDRDKDGKFTGWLFRFDKNGYMKNYDFGIDPYYFYPIGDSTIKEKLIRNIIQFIIFGQETEYKRDVVLDTLSQITRVIW